MEAQKQIRDNTQELHDFLKDLQQWEQIVKKQDNQLKTQSKSEKQTPPVRKKFIKPDNAAKHTHGYFKDKWDKFDVDAVLRQVDEEDEKPADTKPQEDGHTLGTPQTFASAAVYSEADAISEKEFGNEFFKQKKYVQAIGCYSRSIALHPTAVAYANRAMALLKIRRYDDAEADCTEAIALDDRYTKAYARRGTARKERNKLLGAVEDFEFALRLEPQNKELQKQYEEAKALYEKKNPYRPPANKVPVQVHEASEASYSSLAPSEKMVREKMHEKKQERLRAATARAASSATTAVAQNMVSAPKTSYEFETLWRALGNDYSAKARLLKLVDSSSIPKVFRDSLSAALMVDIIKTIGSSVLDLAIQLLENITKVGRFSMTVMCLSRTDKSALEEVWERISSMQHLAMEDIEKAEALRAKYRV